MILINISKTMKERKYFLLGLSLFFFNIYITGCSNQKTQTMVQGDSIGQEERKNDSLLEILRGQEYIYGGEKMSIDSTFYIMDVKAFPFKDKLVVVTGNRDGLGPTYCFVVNTETKKSIMLPSNRGCIGFTSEEGLPICLSFRHHSNGEPGRFSVVSVYDAKGRLVKEMTLEGYEE